MGILSDFDTFTATDSPGSRLVLAYRAVRWILKSTIINTTTPTFSRQGPMMLHGLQSHILRGHEAAQRYSPGIERTQLSLRVVCGSARNS
jgi:hypothetical protein